MKKSATAVVEEMFSAFERADLDGLVGTVSDDTEWIYHGTKIIPKGVFRKKEGIRTFFQNILERTEIISFEAERFIADGNMVVVRGREHQRVKRSGRELKQEWVQIYTVENAEITKMEEFAASEEVK
ncbi:MAG: nuclear transport factor 2 family protein [Myxococcales bacterium]|nr:nuclear transport factor 2 family protein [Myxococcales bacterium]MCB9709244.1 nuclear transport factor 2 family protein [Myxococcales bacterium]